jgi:hypothetical protein
MLLHKSIPVPPPPFRRRRAAARLSGSFGRSLRVVLASLPCWHRCPVVVVPPPAVLARGVHFENPLRSVGIAVNFGLFDKVNFPPSKFLLFLCQLSTGILPPSELGKRLTWQTRILVCPYADTRCDGLLSQLLFLESSFGT